MGNIFQQLAFILHNSVLGEDIFIASQNFKQNLKSNTPTILSYQARLNAG